MAFKAWILSSSEFDKKSFEVTASLLKKQMKGLRNRSESILIPKDRFKYSSIIRHVKLNKSIFTNKYVHMRTAEESYKQEI